MPGTSADCVLWEILGCGMLLATRGRAQLTVRDEMQPRRWTFQRVDVVFGDSEGSQDGLGSRGSESVVVQVDQSKRRVCMALSMHGQREFKDVVSAFASVMAKTSDEPRYPCGHLPRGEATASA